MPFLVLGFPDGSAGKEPSCNVGDTGDAGSILGQGDPLEQEMATYSNILAQEIPWKEEPWWAIVLGVTEPDTAE